MTLVAIGQYGNRPIVFGTRNAAGFVLATD